MDSQTLWYRMEMIWQLHHSWEGRPVPDNNNRHSCMIYPWWLWGICISWCWSLQTWHTCCPLSLPSLVWLSSCPLWWLIHQTGSTPCDVASTRCLRRRIQLCHWSQSGHDIHIHNYDNTGCSELVRPEILGTTSFSLTMWFVKIRLCTRIILWIWYKYNPFSEFNPKILKHEQN